MGWVLAWPGCMNQQLLPVQKHLPLTLDLTVPTPNSLVVDVFGNGIFLLTSRAFTPGPSQISHSKVSK